MTEPHTEHARFGWCTTNAHSRCRSQFTDNFGRLCRCGCPCHREDTRR